MSKRVNLMDFNTNNKINNINSTNIVYGIVAEALPDTLFKVKLDNKEEIVLAYLAGKMRMHRIRVLIGDKVELALDSYGGRARITKRL